MHNGGAPDPGNPNRDAGLGSGHRLWPDAVIVLDGQRQVTRWLRSPLSSIKGFTSTLRSRWDRFDDATKKHLLATIESDTDRVTRLISELLDITRIEARTLQVHPYIVDLRDIAAKVTARLSHGT